MVWTDARRAVLYQAWVAADEAFCAGTMGELAGATTIDGHTIGHGAIGAMTRKLSELYAQRTAAKGTRLVE